mgnify:CR=1 FL=1
MRVWWLSCAFVVVLSPRPRRRLLSFSHSPTRSAPRLLCLVLCASLSCRVLVLLLLLLLLFTLSSLVAPLVIVALRCCGLYLSSDSAGAVRYEVGWRLGGGAAARQRTWASRDRPRHGQSRRCIALNVLPWRAASHHLSRLHESRRLLVVIDDASAASSSSSSSSK